VKNLYLVFITIFNVFISLPVYSELTYFTDVTPTNVYHQYLGTVTIENSSLENGQDELGIYVSDENGGTLLIGATIIGDNYPGYYFISVFGDDSATDIKDGAYINEILTFKIWDKSKDKLYVLSNENSLSVENAAGVNTPELPPKFTSGFGSQFGYLNLLARNEDLLAQIVSITTIPQIESIKLCWTTSMEINNAGFFIFRKNSLSGIFDLMTEPLISSKGNEISGAEYCYIDENVLKSTKYIYQLRSVDLNGQQTVIQTTESLSILQSTNEHCSLNIDFTGDCLFTMADILELMTFLGQ